MDSTTRNDKNATGLNLKTLVQITLLGTLSAVLMLFQFPYPPAPMLKLDIADIPALIGGFAFGPWIGLAIVLLKNLLFILLKFSSEELIGLLMNTLATGTFVGISSYIYHRNKSINNAIFSLAGGVLGSVLVMIPVNFLIMPVFFKMFLPHVPVPEGNQLWAIILFSVIPFNLVKGILNGILTFLVYKRVVAYLRLPGELKPVA